MRIEVGPRFLQVGQDLLHHAVVGAVRVPHKQPDIPAVVNEPPDELLHRIDVGGVNLVGAAALVVGASVLHHADSHKIRIARLIRGGRKSKRKVGINMVLRGVHAPLPQGLRAPASR